MQHYAVYFENRRMELDAETVFDARHIAASLLGIRREDAIRLIECTQNASLAELQADTEDTNCEYSI